MRLNSSLAHLLTGSKIPSIRTLLFACILALIGAPAIAQQTPQNAIKFNPLSLIFRGASFSYERGLNTNQSFQLGAMYSTLRVRKYQYEGFRITPAYRFYLGASSSPLNGVYAGPFAQFQQYKVQRRSTHEKARFSSYGAGFLFGWEKAHKSGLVLDIFAGPSFSKANFSDEHAEDDFDLRSQFTGFGMKTGVAVGFAF